MAATHPDKIWWTTAEIAGACLPDMPRVRQAVEKMVKRLGWREHPDFARKRSGKGGGWEYSWELFPARARRKLLSDAITVETPAEPATDPADQHRYFEELPEASKAKAATRLRTLQAVNAMEISGLTRFLAVDQVARARGVSDRTIWNWFKMVVGVDEAEWLFHLAPRHRKATSTQKKPTCSPEFFELLKGDYLRLERPSFTSSFRRCVKIAKAKGWAALPERTARRRLDELVPRVTQVFAREGYMGLAKCFPPQTRDRTSMVALEGVNADCHKFDVFVQWPGEAIPSRAQIVAFQDLYSGKILSWRVDHNPNKVAVMAAFGDLIEDYGIPRHCLFDNGREFANKWLTGGAKTRFRFKIRDDDPLGVLTLLGIKIHWATPAHGQAKPIERAFRDFADDIAKDPRFAGAYVGNRPDAKPENYGSKAIPVEDFVRVVGEGIVDHNARLGRRTDTTLGRSFDETFAASYATAPIRKASDEQRRLWLMGQEVLTLHKTHGRLSMLGNKYWSDWMNEFAGQKVVARFDPEDLHAGTYLYGLDGAFMGFAACEEKVGFFDAVGAKDHSRKISRIKRMERKLRDELRPMQVDQVAAHLDGLDRGDAATVEAKVVQPDFGGKRQDTATPMRPAFIEASTPEADAQVLSFQAKFQAEQAEQEASQAEETTRERYLRALEVARRSEAGERVGEQEMRWLLGYQKTPEYRGEKHMHEDFGDEAFLK
ncbi:transposase domain-containing protein [Halocynthiibacter namhaensis]|uniref:transposase domain-containing protein n=1 Tax=Halocynthiibacter namhaensis TaxID=1290553 RepID=UPI000578F5D3|nr:transposase domain-containing protein [Halocynthiibacter namhaensis]